MPDTHLATTIAFVNVAEAPRPTRWTMAFDGAGRLLRATQEPALRVKERSIEPAVAEAKGKPLPEADVDLKGKPVPAGDGRDRFKPVPADYGKDRFKQVPQASESYRFKVIGQTGNAQSAPVQ